MKSFKQYITESQKTYSFKLKIAGKCPDDCTAQIKSALAQFDVASVSSGKRTPITAQPHEFPEHKNVEITVFDIATNYPATSKQVHDKVAHVLGKSLNDIRVRNEREEAEIEINHEHDGKTGHAYIGTAYEAADHQDLVGEKRKFDLLKDLSGMKHSLEQKTGINDQILASGMPASAKEGKVVDAIHSNKKIGMTSPVGTKHTKLSPMVGGVKNSLDIPAKSKGKVK
jgi:hypothetical protein